MPRIMDIAHVGMGVGPVDKSVPSQAYAAWRWMRNAAGAPLEAHDGREGAHYNGAFHHVAEVLHIGHDDEKEVRKYLRRSGNARCVSHSKGNTPVWWVADVFAPLTEQQPTAQTVAERKLTPAEAGEDREPAPIVTLYACGECTAVFDNAKARGSHKTFEHASVGCAQCGQVFAGVRVLGVHARTEHPKPRKGRARCRKCGKDIGPATRGHAWYCDGCRTKQNDKDRERKRQWRKERKAQAAQAVEDFTRSELVGPVTAPQPGVLDRLNGFIEKMRRLEAENEQLRAKVARFEALEQALGEVLR